MNASKHPRETILEEQLAALERSAITPLIPGELRPFLEEIARCCVAIEPRGSAVDLAA